MRLADLTSYAPDPKGPFPGLEAASAKIMAAWLKLHANDAERVWYNVRLYPLQSESPDLPPAEATLWRELTALRVDAVVKTPIGLQLLEITPDVTAATVGRLYIYWNRWPLQFPADALTDATLVYERPNPALLASFRQDGFSAEQITP